jgi:predicted O-methyltransferase YrrM
MDFSRLMGLASGQTEARIVQTAIELAVFDALENSTQTATDVAHRLDLDPRATELLLNALAALLLLDKNDASFSLSEAARRFLLKSSPQYLGGMIHFESALWSHWENLPEAIRSGRPVRPPNMYQNDAAETETFINAMDSLVKARGDAEVLAKAIDWSGVADLLDVGSGPATYPIALCARFPKLRVTILDLPATLTITERFVRAAGLSDRITLIAGDYRSDSVPGSYDVILLSNIVHGENPDRNAALLLKLASNLKPGGRIIVKDHILDGTRANPPVGAIFSMLMLLTTDGGRCYSFAEIRSWMEKASLGKVQQIDLPPPLNSSLVIGTKQFDL